MKAGPKGNSPEAQRAHGETRPSRAVVALYADHASRPDPEDLPPPQGMSAAAKKVWNTKVSRYRQRGQKVQGFEDALRQYCELEVRLNKMFKGDAPVNVSMVNTYRMFASEFYDTPASQKVSTNAKPAGNAFARNGRPAAGS